MGEERPEDDQSDLTDAEGDAFDEPYECLDDQMPDREAVLPESVRSQKETLTEAKEPCGQAQRRTSGPLSAVLYRFLTNRNIEDGFVSDRNGRNK